VHLRGAEDERVVVLEGGQTFVPTHPVRVVQERLAAAARAAVASWTGAEGLRDGSGTVRVSFERLHNEAFAGAPGGPAAAAAGRAAALAGLPDCEVNLGWNASCDARLFHELRPEAEVLTFGAGDFKLAHGPDECMPLAALLSGAEALAWLALLYPGSA